MFVCHIAAGQESKLPTNHRCDFRNSLRLRFSQERDFINHNRRILGNEKKRTAKRLASV